MESPLTAINSAVAAVQKIPESRLRCKVASNFKTKNVVPGNVLPLVNADFNNTITTKHGGGVDKALGGVKTTRKSKCN